MSATPATAPLELTTSDGCTLEAELGRPDGEVRAAAVLAHPHPLNGGDMHSTVVDALFHGLASEGVAVVRFNFRGVGRSTGVHGRGVDERLDVEAAVDALAERFPEAPLSLAGWSFGADVALTVVDERVASWFLVAPPLAVVPLEHMGAAGVPRPKRLVVPEHDEFRPPEAARAAAAGWVHTEIEVVPGASHFLVGRTADVVARATAFLLP